MKQTDSLYTFVIGGGAASIAFLLGGIDTLLIALTVFIAVDFLTGLAVGSRDEGVSSKRGFRGLVKKGAMISLVIVSHQLDIVAGNADSHFLRNAMIMFLIAIEGISILENMGRLGIPIPKFLFDRLEQIKGNAEKGGDEDANSKR